jgi:transcriptional antiterminator NusG
MSDTSDQSTASSSFAADAAAIFGTNQPTDAAPAEAPGDEPTDAPDDVDAASRADDAPADEADELPADVDAADAVAAAGEVEVVDTTDTTDTSDAGDTGDAGDAEPPLEDDGALVEDAPVEDPSADGAVVDVEDLIEETVPYDNPFDRPGRWFVVHTQSGYEKRVKQNLEARISSMNMEERIYEVVIPMEEVVEFRAGKKVVVPKKMFPGYLLVRCELDDDAWYVIRNTPGVTGFVGQGNKPSPLPRKDVEMFLSVKPEGEEAAAKRTKPRLEYDINETVRVREGPFADFTGEIIEINEEQLRVKVLVNIFGRETPVELEFSQVAKL